MADRLPMEIQESFDMIDSVKKFLTPQRVSGALNSYLPKFFASISGPIYIDNATVEYMEQESTAFNNRFIANKSAFVPIYRIPHRQLVVVTPLYATQRRGGPREKGPGFTLAESNLLYNLAMAFGLRAIFSIYHNFTKPNTTITPEGKLLFTPNGYMPIICSARVYKEFTQDERFAVYLHEMAHHIQHGMQATSDLLRSPSRILGGYAFVNFVLRKSELLSLPMPLTYGVTIFILLSLQTSAIANRMIELNADSFSASLGQGVYLKSALRKIEADYTTQISNLPTIIKMLNTLGSVLSYVYGALLHPSFKTRYENIDNTKVISSERMPVPVYNVRVIDELDNKIRSALMPYDEMLSR